MGCFDATDAFTNTPIFVGDEATMIWLTKEGAEDDDKMESFRHMSVDIDDYVQQIYKGTYNDYGWLEEVDDPSTPEDLHPHFRTVFVHRSVWDAVVAAMPDVEQSLSLRKILARMGKGPEPRQVDYAAEFWKVVVFAMRCHVDLFAHADGFGFWQFYKEDLRDLRLLHKIRVAEMKKVGRIAKGWGKG